jgi:hypothetical protein
MKFQEAGLSLKTKSLEGIQIGDPFFDLILKLGLERGKHKININRVVVFDGISLRSVDITKGVRNRMTVKNEGKVSQKNKGQISSLGEEVLDAGGKMVGIGSILQFQKIFMSVMKIGGLNVSDAKSKFKALLKHEGSEIGEVVYVVEKFNSPKQLPKFVTEAVDENVLAQISNHPILITNAVVDLDLAGFKTGNDLLTVKFGENYEIGSRDHGRNVIVSAVYDITDSYSGQDFKKTGFLSLNFGAFKFETLKTNRNFEE